LYGRHKAPLAMTRSWYIRTGITSCTGPLQGSAQE
jgi:hypothetical protein